MASLATTLSSSTWSTTMASCPKHSQLPHLGRRSNPAILRLLETCTTWAKKVLDLGLQVELYKFQRSSKPFYKWKLQTIVLGGGYGMMVKSEEEGERSRERERDKEQEIF
ncbi:hypothetical protein L3X38_017394 [Prunus dulcis]|uniref:Uncharacterized protein n=1 Tax=Prunus dulcis TaxID=3755 RepID=A0AAD4ZAP1_PRUDU|nr:hypothetical protein L3X38_017394 [Prunus dulcis]